MIFVSYNKLCEENGTSTVQTTLDILFYKEIKHLSSKKKSILVSSVLELKWKYIVCTSLRMTFYVYIITPYCFI